MAHQKATDEQLVRLNSVGLSLTTIGKILNCHATTITLRLAMLGVPPADTRRSFMEEIFNAMPLPQQEWLMDQLGPHFPIRKFIQTLIHQKYLETKDNK